MSSTLKAWIGICNVLRFVNLRCSMQRRNLKISEFRQETGWNDWQVIGVDNTASASTRNGVSASLGKMEVPKMSNLSITTEDAAILPVHPGEILMEDFILGFGITQNKLAVAIGVPPRRINEIVHGKRGITADTAIRLARYFGTSEELWMNLQSNYELRLERRVLRDKIATITPLKVA